jgi:hypothetical protein
VIVPQIQKVLFLVETLVRSLSVSDVEQRGVQLSCHGEACRLLPKRECTATLVVSGPKDRTRNQQATTSMKELPCTWYI